MASRSSSSSTERDIEKNTSRTDEKSEQEAPQPPTLTYDTPPWYLRVPFTMTDPPPPSGTLNDAKVIPEANANIFSVLTFSWVFPILNLGYARPLEVTDLWKLDDSRKAHIYAEKILDSFERRHKAAEEYNARLAAGEIQPGWRKWWWSIRGNRAAKEEQWRTKDARRQASLTMALNDAVGWYFWWGGLAKVVADVAQITSPLVVKALIRYSTQVWAAHKFNVGQSPPVGKGVGLAIALFLMQVIASLTMNFAFYRSLGTGVLLRAGLITAIYKRSLRFTARARSTLPSGKLVNHISTDVSRIDFCAGFFHFGWTSVIQMAICLALLIINLGPSALAGFGLFILVTPIQTSVMKKLFMLRKKSMGWTDKRAKLLQELLGGMKIIKVFAWEIPFLKRIGEYRTNELKSIRTLLMIRAGNNAVAFSLPVLAAVLSFVVYSVTGHRLEADVVFASLTLFQLLRMPLMLLPVSLSSMADASNAISRLHPVFTAELLEDTHVVDTSLPVAVRVHNAGFSWDGAPPNTEEKSKKVQKAEKAAIKAAKKAGEELAKEEEKGEERIFKMNGVTFDVPKGQLCAVVGPVGSGKSSLLQGILGEMRRTEGEVIFGGSVSYCAQSAWIQGTTIRENILFGRPYDEEKYLAVIHDASLQADLDMLPQGDLTEVGEKGISLSGGQKQRINIARAVYCAADIICLDDPFSALDAHVGKHVFENAIKGALADKTRILVTHALHFLPQTDYIITLVDGRVAERGTYAELMAKDGEFAKFVTEFGGKEEEEEKQEEEEEDKVKAVEGADPAEVKEKKKAVPGKALMQVEERATGAVSSRVYKDYFAAANGKIMIPLLFLVLVLTQGAQVMASYWLVYWQEEKWPQPQGFYMGIYAGLGAAQAITLFLMGSCFALMTFYASVTMHRDAIQRIMHAPMSFFDTTPLGRIMNRFSKDVDTLDNMLGEAIRMLSATLSQIIGAVILIGIVLPWFLIAVGVISIVYYFAALFYRSSARELKRLDAILRSSLYSHFSESLSGLATIRAYGETERFRRENEERMDIEDRAYWLTITNQRWLGIRLDFLGSILTFVVAILTVASAKSISPSQTGVTLSYILLVQQSFGWMVRQAAEVENDMNSVERVQHYAKELEQEAPHEIPSTQPPPEWPSRGELELKNVVMSYRPGLPPVLKGLSLHVHEGEHIGIVGRTGAGKSSIMVALYRLVEINSGSITLDGIDVSTIGLTDLRSKVAIIPQDPILFSGTLRTNLDPFGVYDDARLWDALRRASLVSEAAATKAQGTEEATSSDEPIPSGASTPTANRFTLDSPIEDEGSNLSVGQRSLVSLARALVKDSRVVLLDEATASVDYETDAAIQDTIRSEFGDRTLLCIAHRIKTIIGYDRICVMDAGNIAELDTPRNLFLQPTSIFRSMCDRSGITLSDIEIAAKEREEAHA